MGTGPGAPWGPLRSICSEGSRRQLPGGKAGGQEGGTALCSARALGAPSATAPNPQAATAFQINSLALPGSLFAPGGVVPLRPKAGLSLSCLRWLALAPSEPRSPPLWPGSPALPLSHTPSHSQSLSASFSQVLLFLAHACALPHRLIFSLPSPLPPGFWSLSSALSGAGNPPPPQSPRT